MSHSHEIDLNEQRLKLQSISCVSDEFVTAVAAKRLHFAYH